MGAKAPQNPPENPDRPGVPPFPPPPRRGHAHTGGLLDKCRWTYDDTHDKHDTGCGEAFTFNDGGPDDNGFFYCPYCGRRITEA